MKIMRVTSVVRPFSRRAVDRECQRGGVHRKPGGNIPFATNHVPDPKPNRIHQPRVVPMPKSIKTFRIFEGLAERAMSFCVLNPAMHGW